VEVGAGSPANGRTLQDLELRSRTGVTVIAVRRGDEVLPNPAADLTLADGDVLVLLGTAAKTTTALALLEKGSLGETSLTTPSPRELR